MMGPFLLLLVLSSSALVLGEVATSSESCAKGVVSVLHEGDGLDKEFQRELLKASFISLRELDRGDLRPEFIDLAAYSKNNLSGLVGKVKGGSNNCSATGGVVIISLLEGEKLSQFASLYDKEEDAGQLTVFTPRLTFFTGQLWKRVTVKSLQMSPEALATALLSRVERVRIAKLIPILDSQEDAEQMRWTQVFRKEGAKFLKPVELADPIFLDKEEGVERLRNMLAEGASFRNLSSSSVGVLLLAKRKASLAISLAKEKGHLTMGWFSPYVIEYEEALEGQGQGQDQGQGEVNGVKEESQIKANFGLYTVTFVGSSGWDSPERRRLLRELNRYTGASPRILPAVLAHDAALLAVQKLRGEEPHAAEVGASGLLSFDKGGHRKEGTYFGSSSIPQDTGSIAALIQPSTWILEERLDIVQSDEEGGYLVKDFQKATSSLLTKEELLLLSNRTKVDCGDRVMNLVSHDPYNQLPYNYYFKEANLPQHLVIPNQHGFGLTFLCFHHEPEGEATSLKIACTPGAHEGVHCFRSHLLRRRRSAMPVDVVPTQYQFFPSQGQSKWSKPKEEENGGGFYYNSFNQFSTPYPVNIRRQDTSVAAAAEVTTPAPPASTPKLPELRQILKAAKPFVGSCIGSTTGCAMCVLVLGRLPLGAVPAACTGPCFVGTFGSCGSLLGRVFSETTVICTELFRQGFLDPETFVADAEFGQIMKDQFPTTMQGYTLLATPLVEAMKKSELVTKFVAFFALPWAHHMKFLLGRAGNPSLLGLLVHTLGFPLCNLVGYIYEGWTLSSIYQTITLVLLSFLLLLLTFTFTFTTTTRTGLRLEKMTKSRKWIAAPLQYYWRKCGSTK